MKRERAPMLAALILIFAFPLVNLSADPGASSDSITAGPNGPDQMLRSIADDLEAGNIDQAKKHFSKDYPFEKMDAAGRKVFADFYRGCKPKGYTDHTWIYHGPMQIPNGQTVDQEVVIERMGSNDWIIDN